MITPNRGQPSVLPGYNWPLMGTIIRRRPMQSTKRWQLVEGRTKPQMKITTRSKATSKMMVEYYKIMMRKMVDNDPVT